MRVSQPAQKTGNSVPLQLVKIFTSPPKVVIDATEKFRILSCGTSAAQATPSNQSKFSLNNATKAHNSRVGCRQLQIAANNAKLQKMSAIGAATCRCEKLPPHALCGIFFNIDGTSVRLQFTAVLESRKFKFKISMSALAEEQNQNQNIASLGDTAWFSPSKSDHVAKERKLAEDSKIF